MWVSPLWICQTNDELLSYKTIKMQSAVLGLIKENEGTIKYILMTDVNNTELPQVSYGRMRICKYLGRWTGISLARYYWPSWSFVWCWGSLWSRGGKRWGGGYSWPWPSSRRWHTEKFFSRSWKENKSLILILMKVWMYEHFRKRRQNVDPNFYDMVNKWIPIV